MTSQHKSSTEDPTSQQSTGPMEFWSVDDVTAFLSANGLKHLEEVFVRHYITGYMLPYLNNAALQKMGIKKKEDKVRLLKAIKTASKKKVIEKVTFVRLMILSRCNDYE